MNEDEWKPTQRHLMAVYRTLSEDDQRAIDARARRHAEDRPGGYVENRAPYEAWLAKQDDELLLAEVNKSLDWGFSRAMGDAFRERVLALRDPVALRELEAENRARSAGSGNLLERLAAKLATKKDANAVKPLRAAPARDGDDWEEGRE